MPTWERRLYAAAILATPLLVLTEDRISAAVIPADTADGDARQLAILHAIRAADGLWVVDCFVALLWGLAMVAGTIGLVKLTRRTAPRITVAAAVVGTVGATGLCMHAVFWNVVHGGMARAADLPAMVDFVDRTESYPPFIATLVWVILGADLGLVLCAAALWRSRTVPWWAAVAAVVFPLNDFFGSQGWPYVLSCLLWVVGWGAAGLALVRRRDETVQPRPARSKASASAVSAASFSSSVEP